MPGRRNCAWKAVAANNFFNGYWSPVVHRLTPYVPGEQPKLSNLVKLNTNENPYGPSPRVLDAIRAELSDACACTRTRTPSA
jgi:hypothetical protein